MYSISVQKTNTQENRQEVEKLADTLRQHLAAMQLTDSHMIVVAIRDVIMLLISDIYKDDINALYGIIDREIDYDQLKIGRPH